MKKDAKAQRAMIGGWLWFKGPHWGAVLFLPVVQVQLGRAEIDRFNHMLFHVPVTFEVNALVWYFVSGREISIVTRPLQG